MLILRAHVFVLALRVRLRSEVPVANSDESAAELNLLSAFETRLNLHPSTEIMLFDEASAVVLPPPSTPSTPSILFPNGYRDPVRGYLETVGVHGDVYMRVTTKYCLELPEWDGDGMRQLEVTVPRNRELWPTQYRIEGPGFSTKGRIMRKAAAEAACARALREGRSTTMASSEPGNVFVVMVGLPSHVKGTLHFFFEQVDALPSMGVRELTLPLMPFNPLATGPYTLKDQDDDHKRQRVGDVSQVRVSCIAGPIGCPSLVRTSGLAVHEVPSDDDASDRQTYLLGDAKPAQLLFRAATDPRSLRWSAGPHTLALFSKSLIMPASAERAPEAVVFVCDISGSMGDLTLQHGEGSILDMLAAHPPFLNASRRDVQALMVVDLARYLFARGTTVVYVCPFGSEVDVHPCSSEGEVEAIVRDPRDGGDTHLAESIETVFRKVSGYAKKPTTMVVLTDDISSKQRSVAQWESSKHDAGMQDCRVVAAKFGTSVDGPIANLVKKQVKRLFESQSVRFDEVQSHLDDLRTWALDTLDGCELPEVEDASGKRLEVAEHPSSPTVCIGGTDVRLPLQLVARDGERRELRLDEVPAYSMPDAADRLRVSIGLMGLPRLSSTDEKLDRCVELQVLCPGLAFQTDIDVAPPFSSAASAELSAAMAQATAPATGPEYRSLSALADDDDAAAFRSLSALADDDDAATYVSLSAYGAPPCHRSVPPAAHLPLDCHHLVMCAIRTFADGGTANYASVVSLVSGSAVPGCSLLHILRLLSAATAGATPSDVDDIRRACDRLRWMLRSVAHHPSVRAVQASVDQLMPTLEATA
jgi:hypothetical protein